MNSKSTEKAINDLKKTVEILILLEFCKLGATRKQIRNILGGLDNNFFSAINTVVKGGKQNG